jgi:hypothetical protein
MMHLWHVSDDKDDDDENLSVTGSWLVSAISAEKGECLDVFISVQPTLPHLSYPRRIEHRSDLEGTKVLSFYSEGEDKTAFIVPFGATLGEVLEAVGCDNKEKAVIWSPANDGGGGTAHKLTAYDDDAEFPWHITMHPILEIANDADDIDDGIAYDLEWIHD